MTAAAVVGALEVAIETWRAERARRPISVLLRAAFKELGPAALKNLDAVLMSPAPS